MPPSNRTKRNAKTLQNESRSIENSPSNEPSVSLTGRDPELSKLDAFLCNGLENRSPDSLYISGPPGTGKTACVRRAVTQLAISVKSDYVDIYVNCMEIKTPASLFRSIYQKLCGVSGEKQRKPLGQAKSLPEDLELELTKRKGPMIVLVMDEIDQLETKNRDILYTVFRWPGLPNSRVILVGIANSLDLTKRLLPKLNLKDCRTPHQMQFRAYSSTQVMDILKTKLSQDAFDSSAVELCARKVSAITGDIRKALDICRMSLDKTPNAPQKRKLNELQLSEPQSPKVSCREVLNTVKEVYGSKTERLSLSLPIQQKLILASALALSSSGKKQFPKALLISAYKKSCKIARVTPLNTSECSNLCELLETQGLICVSSVRGSTAPSVRLLVDDASAKEVLNDEALVGTVMKTVLV